MADAGTGRPRRISFLDAAERILTEAGEPLGPEEIVERATDSGLIASKGATPGQTMKSKLSTDVLNRKEASRFKRSGKNLFALRVWAHVPEFFADRYQKALLDEDIVAFSADVLRDFFPTDGITRLDFESGQDLVSRLVPVQRLEAEERFDIIQLVSQFLVIHHHRVATHKRTRRLPESRLHGVHSLLFGGHLNPDDVAPLFGPFDPLNGPQYIRRELSEEVRIQGEDPSLSAWITQRRATGDDPVFPARSGGHLSTDAVARLLTQHITTATAACPSLAGKTISPHTLRHTCAMNLLQAGIDTSSIALWLGHANTRSTQAYLHADMSMKEAALATTAPPDAQPCRYQPGDDLLAYLEGL